MSRYSNDLRKQVAKQFDRGGSIIDIQKEYGIGQDTLYIWRKKHKQGTLFDILNNGKRPARYDLQGLKNFVTKYPDKILREIRNEFFDGKASLSGIDVALKRMDFRLKKKSNYLQKEMKPKDKFTKKT
jgi:transposase-like protein